MRRRQIWAARAIALSEADLGKVTDMGEYKIEIEPTPELSSPPKRRGRPPKVKRDV